MNVQLIKTINVKTIMCPKKSTEVNTIALSNEFITDIWNIITTSRTAAIRSVDFERVQMYWKIGERIVTEEQGGKDRAEYGTYLLQNLANKMETEFGSGFSYRQLAFCRQFYLSYPIGSYVN